MSRVIGRPLDEIRSEFGLPMLPGRAVCVAVHEAAHAAVGIAHGATVTSIVIKSPRPLDGSRWSGECHFTRYELTRSEEAEAVLAGIASASFLHDTVAAGYDRFQAGAGDIEDVCSMGIQKADAWTYIDAARRTLRAHVDLLDHLAAALLVTRREGTFGRLSKDDVQVIHDYVLIHQPATQRRDTSRSTGGVQNRMISSYSPQEVMI